MGNMAPCIRFYNQVMEDGVRKSAEKESERRKGEGESIREIPLVEFSQSAIVIVSICSVGFPGGMYSLIFYVYG